MADITRWDPFAGLTSLHSQIDDIFNTAFSAPLSRAVQAPALDLYIENDKELVAEAHVPGFTKDDVEVSVHNGILEIKGERHEKNEPKDTKRNYMMRESHASFYRSIVLPKTADGDKVKAHFDNGVLKVTVPLKELPAPKKIAIESSKQK